MKIIKEQMSLFGNSRAVTVQDMQTGANHRQSRETKGRSASVGSQEKIGEGWVVFTLKFL